MSVINQDYIEKYLFENLKPKDELLERLEKEAHKNHVPRKRPSLHVTDRLSQPSKWRGVTYPQGKLHIQTYHSNILE